MSLKIICPECSKASAPKKPRTFDCPACGYHSNFSVNIDGSAHYYKAGRKGEGLRVQAWRVRPEQAKLTGETVRFALDKCAELGYISYNVTI